MTSIDREGIKTELKVGATIAFLAILAMLLTCLTFGSCKYQQPTCAAINLADEACKYVTIRFPDGHTEEVPKEQAVGALRRAGLVR